MSQARLREALIAGGPGTKEKGPPVADGVLSVTPDTPEAVEWRSRQSVIDVIASSSTYLDDDDDGVQPSDLYGKYTWTVGQFAEVSKRELRSGTFEAGGFKWYILVYPQGCDVANHLSLFLCVAEYDKLLPGWAHFAQFTVSVSHRDPHKSKYSDTLHRFCKKEHDWGWKKFMELGKVGEGFTAGDQLVVRAQVQVIRDRPARPFRTLDPQYRRELLRVYLANVEGIARRFVDEKRGVLAKLLEPASGGNGSGSGGFVEYWRALAPPRQAELACEPAASVYKGLIKRFFNEKEVTSTLVMDALYCGAKALEEAGRIFLSAAGGAAAPSASAAAPAAACPPAASAAAGTFIDAERRAFFIGGDVVEVLQRCAADTVPPFTPDTASADAAASRHAATADDSSRDSVERDERRLADLGRRCVEMYAVAHIVESRLEGAWMEAETIKRQEALIRAEEEESVEEAVKAEAKAEADKERRARKKEKQRKRKEAERAKREVEEAEARRAEGERRAEAARRQRDTEERQRREDAERERQVVAAREQADAKRKAEVAARAAARAAAPTASDPAGAASHAQAAPSECECSSEDTGSALGSARSDRSAPAPPANGGPHAHGAAYSASTSMAVSPESHQPLVHPAIGPGPAPSHADLASSAASTDRSGERAASQDQLEELKMLLGRATLVAAEKDAEIAKLRARVCDLEGQLAAARAAGLGPAPAAGPPSRPASAASSTHSPGRAGDPEQRSLTDQAAAAPSALGTGDGVLENGHAGPLGHAGPAKGSAPAAAAAATGSRPPPPRAALVGISGASPSGAILATAHMAGKHRTDGAAAAQQRAAAACAVPPRPGQLGGDMLRHSSAPEAATRGGAVGAPPPAPSGIRHVGSLPAMSAAAAHFSPAGLAAGAPGPYSQAARGGTVGPGAGGSGYSAGRGAGSYRSVAVGNGSVSATGAGVAIGGLPPRPASAQQVQRGSSDGLPPTMLANSVVANERMFMSSPIRGPQRQQQAQGARAFSSPLPTAKQADALGPMESPGLDDFAHMGLITDLLE